MRRGSAAIVVVLTALSLGLVSGIGSPSAMHAQENSAAQAQKSLDEAAILGPPQGRPLAGAELDARTRALGERMRCPICQGSSIADSPSGSAMSMLAQVRDLLARGYTDEQVLDYFVGSYGEFVLLEPTTQGFNLVVWLLPLAGVLIGAVLIAARLRGARARRGAAAKAGGASAGTDAARQREVDDPELARYVERVRTEVGS